MRFMFRDSSKSWAFLGTNTQGQLWANRATVRGTQVSIPDEDRVAVGGLESLSLGTRDPISWVLVSEMDSIPIVLLLSYKYVANLSAGRFGISINQIYHLHILRATLITSPYSVKLPQSNNPLFAFSKWSSIRPTTTAPHRNISLLSFNMSTAPPPQHQPYQTRHHITPLTSQNLSQLPLPPRINRDIYLQADQNFERVPLGLPTNRPDGNTILRDWERVWEIASAGR